MGEVIGYAFDTSRAPIVEYMVDQAKYKKL